MWRRRRRWCARQLALLLLLILHPYVRSGGSFGSFLDTPGRPRGRQSGVPTLSALAARNVPPSAVVAAAATVVRVSALLLLLCCVLTDYMGQRFHDIIGNRASLLTVDVAEAATVVCVSALLLLPLLRSHGPYQAPSLGSWSE